MFTFHSTHLQIDGPELARWRARHWQGLGQAQDLYSERLVQQAQGYWVQHLGRTVGYGLLGPDATLLEFAVHDTEHASAALAALLAELRPTQALAKSYDHRWLNLLARHSRHTHTLGHVFGRVLDRHFEHHPGVRVRVAQPPDQPRVWQIHDDFFDDALDLARYIDHGQLLLYELGGELLGCGLWQPVMPGQATHDLGMLVASAHRRQGFGQYIVRHLIAQTLAQGLQPVAACGADNPASRACLRAAGFGGEHQLLQVELS